LPRESRKALRERTSVILAGLAEAYPESECSLTHDDPLQLIVATVLSAQCTDAAVNRATPALFARFRTAEDYANASQEEMEGYLGSLNFFRNKSRSLIGLGRALVERHRGQVPADLEALTQLPGVGRKTANVVRSVAMGVPGLPVDTHVGRLARRLGLTTEDDPVKVEMALNPMVPAVERGEFSLRLILHGRAVCRSRRPRCEDCVLNDFCPSSAV
jgi:endonuclease III